MSRLRLITFLNQHAINPSLYRIYSKAIDKSTPIQPGMHHALHKPDFSFDFKDMLLQRGDSWQNVAELAGLHGDDFDRFNQLCARARMVPDSSNNSSADLFLEAVGSKGDYPDGTMRSTKRRRDTHLLCDVYTKVKEKVESTNHNSAKFGKIEELIGGLQSNRGTAKPIFYVGGPFTETLEIIKGLETHNVGQVIAMAGASHGNSNIFANQFNILVDPSSAKLIFDLALKKEVDLTLIPTECVKDTPYQLSWKDLEDASESKKCAHIRELYHQWHPDHGPINPFDILAAMAATTELYKGMLKSVKFKVNTEGTFEFADEKHAPEHGPGLKMFWNGPSKMVKAIPDGTNAEKKARDVLIEADQKNVSEKKKDMLSRRDDYITELKETFGYGTQNQSVSTKHHAASMPS